MNTKGKPRHAAGRWFLVGVVAWWSFLPTAEVRAAAVTPKVMVEKQVQRFAEIVASGQPDRLLTLRNVVREMFDYERFSELVLGKRWQTLGPDQKRRFSAAMRRLLESGYMKRPDKIFAQHRVLVQQEKISGDKAEVRGLIKQDDVDVEIAVLMVAKRGTWVAYDVVFDGISLLDDYKAQFLSFLEKRSLDQLVERLNRRSATNEAATENKVGAL